MSDYPNVLKSLEKHGWYHAASIIEDLEAVIERLQRENEEMKNSPRELANLQLAAKVARLESMLDRLAEWPCTKFYVVNVRQMKEYAASHREKDDDRS